MTTKNIELLSGPAKLCALGIGGNTIDDWETLEHNIMHPEEYERSKIESKSEVISINGIKMINFNTCSYLGLHLHPNAIAGSKHASSKYGTQYSASRAFTSLPLYTDLETLYSKIYPGKSILVTPSTTYCHFAFMTAFIGIHDIVILDSLVHASVKYASQLCKARGVNVQTVDGVGGAISLVSKLLWDSKNNKKNSSSSSSIDKIYFFIDGIYSMQGACVDVEAIRTLASLDSKRVIVYVDDAHGMSLDGINGQGVFYTQFCATTNNTLPDNIVLAVSMSKGWGSSGGALVLADKKERDILIYAPSPIFFGGPLPPPVLGANIAIAKLHLDGTVALLQHELRLRMDYFSNRLSKHPNGIVRFLLRGRSPVVPIYYFVIGDEDRMIGITTYLKRSGIYVAPVPYPVVPKSHIGIRLSISANHSFSQLDFLVDALASVPSSLLSPSTIHSRL